MIEVEIKTRFCGPKSSGNGGYSAGLFAQAIEGPAAVMLKRPPPLNAPISLKPLGDSRYEAVCDDALIALAEPAAVNINAPDLPDDDSVAAAHEAFLSDAGGEHLIPYCFVCGNRREKGDGLRIFSGPVKDSPVNADFWTPTRDLAAEDGFVRPEFLWAALDCPCAFATRVWPRLTLLSRMAIDIRRRPRPGERLVIAAWADGHDGRKHHASSVLLDEKRDVIAAANTLWIEVANEALIAQLAADRVQ